MARCGPYTQDGATVASRYGVILDQWSFPVKRSYRCRKLSTVGWLGGGGGGVIIFRMAPPGLHRMSWNFLTLGLYNTVLEMLFPAKRSNPALASLPCTMVEKALSPSGLKFPSLGDQFS